MNPTRATSKRMNIIRIISLVADCQQLENSCGHRCVKKTPPLTSGSERLVSISVFSGHTLDGSWKELFSSINNLIMTSIGDITVRTGYTPIRLTPLVLCHICTASSVHDISALSQLMTGHCASLPCKCGQLAHHIAQ